MPIINLSPRIGVLWLEPMIPDKVMGVWS